VHPGAGALLYVIFIVVSHSNSTNGGKTAPYVILPIIMSVLLVVQVGAVMVARRRSGP